LLVGENEQEGVTELIFIQHALEFVTGLANTIAIVGIHDKDDALRVLEVVTPQGTDLVLAPDIPNGEGDILVFNGLNVETDGGDGGDNLTELELIEDCGLARSVQPDHEDAHLLLAKEALEQFRDGETHLFVTFGKEDARDG